MHQPPDYFKALIIRFLEKSITDNETDELYQWLQRDRLHLEWFDRYNERFQNTKVLNHFTPEKVDAAWKRFQERIGHENDFEPGRSIAVSKRFPLLRIAASVALLLAAFAFYWKLSFTTSHQAPGKTIVVDSPVQKRAHITLPDSTMVWLNANSTLEYGHDFGSADRIVKLNGEAFFDVRKKARQDFIVRTDHVSIRVEGTRFNISAYQGEDANTTLEEGKVELFIDGEPGPYALTPGDQVIVKRYERKITLKKVDPSNFTAWKEAALVFDNTPLSEIILKLENRFKVEIDVADEIARRERLTMKVTSETIDEILEMIELSSRLHYTKNENHILIYD